MGGQHARALSRHPVQQRDVRRHPARVDRDTLALQEAGVRAEFDMLRRFALDSGLAEELKWGWPCCGERVFSYTRELGILNEGAEPL